ncbi:MAG: STAS domain-containing protein [Salinivirgaceae bacterium]|jgi:anti-anti-sigma regulatory factor|nr:STAS domain-containing protein [Salinivirgaceae bacterium]
MNEYKITSTKNKETKALEISLQGHLNISNITEIQKKLNSAIKKSKKIYIELTKVDDADISIIQLLAVLKNNCNESNIEIDINFDLNIEISELFSRAGFANTII